MVVSGLTSSFIGDKIFINGTLTVQQPSGDPFNAIGNLLFDDQNVTMYPESAIDVLESGISPFFGFPASRLQINNGSHLHGHPDCPCLWRGIRIFSNAGLFTDGNSIIEDALYAVEPARTNNIENERPFISMVNTTLINNYMGMKAAGGAYNGTSVTDDRFNLAIFMGNTFDNSRELYDICGNALTTPYCFDIANGFCGIYLNGLSEFIVPTAGAFNTFQNLPNGIVSDDSNVDIGRCRFLNLLPEQAYEDCQIESSGFGIRFRATTSRSFAQTGLGMDGITAFENVLKAVFVGAEAGGMVTTASCTGNHMDDVQVGIDFSSQFGNINQALANSNSIHATSLNNPILNPVPRGVVITDFDGTLTSNFTVSSNVIETDAVNAIGVYVTGPPFIQAPNPNLNANITENEILVTEGSAGIRLDNFGSAGVTLNRDIDLVPNFAIGVKVEGGTGHRVHCNNIINANGPQNGTTGIQVIESPTGAYHGNFIRNTGTGLQFVSNCNAPNEIKCNEFAGSHNRGLQYDFDGINMIFAVTGEQINQGNMWGGPFLPFSANNDGGSQGADLSPYEVENLPPPLITPSGWFFDNN